MPYNSGEWERRGVESDRLLDRLTKQQEINQSLRAENAKLKADIKLTDDAERDIAQLSADLAMKDKIILGLREAKYQLSIKHEAEIEKLKAELLDINAKHHRDTQKTCLKARFDTWRESQVKYNSDYNIEDEAFWLVGEAINIIDAVDIFNELYEDGAGDESTYKLICDHERNWQLEQLYMDDEGEYTLTEEEWEAQAEQEKINENTCDFCENERKVLTKRDAGYDEWTCSTCHKEQYPEHYEEKQ